MWKDSHVQCKNKHIPWNRVVASFKYLPSEYFNAGFLLENESLLHETMVNCSMEAHCFSVEIRLFSVEISYMSLLRRNKRFLDGNRCQYFKYYRRKAEAKE